MRVGGFPDPDESLDDGGRRKAEARRIGVTGPVLTSPALAARQTADAMGLDAQPDQTLRDLDYGPWSGRTFEAVAAEAPEAFAAWLADPSRAAPGGETFAGLQVRAAAFLDAQRGVEAPIAAVTHPMTIRAIMAAALDMPAAATFRIDVAPLSKIVLSFQGVWRLQSLGADPATAA